MIKNQRKPALPIKQHAKLRFGKNALVFLGLFGIYCFVNVWQNVSIGYLNRQNESLRKELNSLLRACDDLTFDVERLKDPGRIQKALSAELDLRPAEKVNIKKFYR